MTKFRIIGCNKESGEDVDFVIEASTYLDAQKKANDLGCLVSDVRPENPPNTAPKQKINAPINESKRDRATKEIWSSLFRELFMLIGRAIVTCGYFFLFMFTTFSTGYLLFYGGEDVFGYGDEEHLFGGLSVILPLLVLTIVIVIFLPKQFKKSKSTLSFFNRISLFYYLTRLIKYFFKNA